MRRLIVLLLLPVLAFATPAAAAPEFPPLTGRVVDAANIIPDDVEASLDQKLAALETQSQRQLVVATIPNLQGYEISDYGYQLGRAWGIGDAERNDGVLLLVAPNERKVRIEVGYGMEPIITDGLSFLIVNNEILPRFKDGDMAGGIVAGTDALIHQMQLPKAEARAIAAKAQERPQSDGFPIGAVLWMLFIVFFIVLPMIGRAGGRRHRGRHSAAGAVGDVLLWTAINAAMSGGRGGSSGGGGFSGFGSGGGGFSGGGGSFGGGGASGSW
jgi:uncharacterized protein